MVQVKVQVMFQVGSIRTRRSSRSGSNSKNKFKQWLKAEYKTEEQILVEVQGRV